MLVWRFVEDSRQTFGRRVESISKDNMEMLQRYSWPGNVRELRNLVERAVIGAKGPDLTITLPQTSSSNSVQRSVKLVRCGEGAHQGGAREHEMEDSWRRWRGRSTRAQSHDPRDAHGQTGAAPPASLTPTFRAPSAIQGICVRRLLADLGQHIGQKVEPDRQHSDIEPTGRAAGTSGALDPCVVRLAVALAPPARGTNQLVHALRLLASPTRIEPGCLGCRVWIEDNERALRALCGGVGH